MRYVPANCLREGMTLARNIYSHEGHILLSEGIVLEEPYIQQIKGLLLNGIYINDNISKNIEIQNIISDQLRVEAVNSIKSLYNDKSILANTTSKVEYLARHILTEILANKNLMVNMIDIKTFDNYLYSHSVNVAILSTIIGIAYNLDPEKLEKLTMAALLHDVGKLFIPRDILNKDTELTVEEEKIYEAHAHDGFEYIKKHYNLPIMVYVAILQHHERYDGKGFPEKRKGDEIFIFARIISICNIYDELISGTPNNKALLPSEAIEYIMGNNATAFDPDLVKIFLRRVAPYPLGTIVELSNGVKAIVVENNEFCSIRPKVRALQDNRILDLTYDWNLRNVTIVNVDRS